MYRKISIRNFRSFADVEVDNLRRINLLVGRNNSGKTTLLEALFLHGGATNPANPHTLAGIRGQQVSRAISDPVWRSLYRNFDPAAPIEIEAWWDDEKTSKKLRIEALAASYFSDPSELTPVGAGVAQLSEDLLIGGLRLDYVASDGTSYETRAVFDPTTGQVDAPVKQRSDFVAGAFLSSRAFGNPALEAEQLSQLKKAKRDQEVVDALAIVEPSIKGLDIVADLGVSTVYADIGLPRLAPLAVCGEGVVRLFSIVVNLIACRGGVLLVDEIDNGLHYTVLEKLWNVLRQMAVKHDVQVFATTHNEELIDSAIRVFHDDLSLLGLFRLDRRDGKHLIASYNEPALRAKEAEDFEVRG